MNNVNKIKTAKNTALPDTRFYYRILPKCPVNRDPNKVNGAGRTCETDEFESRNEK